LRAYISVRAVTLYEIEEGGSIGAEIVMQNVGLTIAKDFNIVSTVTVSDWPRTTIFVIGGIVWPGGVPHTVTDISPTVTVTNTIDPVAISDEDRVSIFQRRKAIYCTGQITYNDVFGDSHTIHFKRHKVGPAWLDGKPMQTSPGGNDTESHKPKTEES
jgi:hypothetical protein